MAVVVIGAVASPLLPGCRDKGVGMSLRPARAFQADKGTFERTAGGWRARGGGLAYRFSDDGRVELRRAGAGAAEAGDVGTMRLAGVGRCGQHRPKPPKAFRREPGVLERVRADGVVERFVHRERGLEQVFVLQERPRVPPACEGKEAPRVELQLQLDDLVPVMARGDRAVLAARRGGVRVAYDKLAVFDARGRRLPASLARADDELRIHVDDREAVYPIQVDPLIVVTGVEAKLQLEDPIEGARFGATAVLWGDFAAVSSSTEPPGVAHVFKRTSSRWTRIADLSASRSELKGMQETLGNSLALWDDTLVVGGGTEGPFVYRRDAAGGWFRETRLLGSDVSLTDRGSTTVAIWDNTVAVAVNFGGMPGKNAVYMFRQDGRKWTEEAKLTAAQAGARVFLGGDGLLAVGEDIVAVGGGRGCPAAC